MCDACSKLMFVCAMGNCSSCTNGTSSSSHMYCPKCAMAKNACQACGKVDLAPLGRGSGGPAQ